MQCSRFLLRLSTEDSNYKWCTSTRSECLQRWGSYFYSHGQYTVDRSYGDERKGGMSDIKEPRDMVLYFGDLTKRRSNWVEANHRLGNIIGIVLSYRNNSSFETWFFDRFNIHVNGSSPFNRTVQLNYSYLIVNHSNVCDHLHVQST